MTKAIEKIIGYWIAWILTIGWASVMITKDDIAQEYKANTWKELTINESELVTFEEVARDAREGKIIFEEVYNAIDCNNYEYNFHSSCTEVKTTLKSLIKATDWSIACYDKLAKDNNLEKVDLINCISSEKATRDAAKQFFIKTEWICNADCQSSLDLAEYNIAVFQAYLNKAK